MLRTEMQSRFQALEKNKKICTHGRNMKRFIKKAVGSFTRLFEKSEGFVSQKDGLGVRLVNRKRSEYHYVPNKTENES